ncbi:MAG: hydroxymethylbilane synthase [Thermoprotei archaeon]
MKLIVGTRGSKLSLIQTNEVVEALKKIDPEIQLQIKVIKTKGDIDTQTPLYSMSTKGIFEKEIDHQLINGEIDLAVHSMKDYPTDVPEQLIIAAVPPRKSPFDILITRDNTTIEKLKPNTTIGTSSLRRVTHIKYLRPDINTQPIRGNIDTRIRKLEEGKVDALLIAEAGLNRLNINYHYQRLGPELITPAAGQGALAVVTRKDNTRLINILNKITDHKTLTETTIERKILEKLQAGCKTPLGVYANIIDNRITLITSLISPDYKKRILIKVQDNNPNKIIENTTKEFADRGGEEIIKQWRQISWEKYI